MIPVMKTLTAAYTSMTLKSAGVPAGSMAAVYFQWFGFGYFYSHTPGHV